MCTLSHCPPSQHARALTYVVSPCKHLLFVYRQVLGVCIDTRCVRRSALHPSEVSWLLGLPMSRASLAEDSVRKWFHQLHPLGKKQQQQERSFSSRPSLSLRIEDGSCCPVCLDEIRKRDKFKYMCCLRLGTIH
ncbi:hypothetical protein RchiOBHm_Chr6g0306391 [Rosa chinensis]|uniref:Uncharacterized protein n=1 Tax=Rosa chinensis TaxID=74649 RepID=A0A2P6Q034_ROSCH|nr:hypothetical protein RchiOBHm_Chr6g0306391 [Rosa chinensis]